MTALERLHIKYPEGVLLSFLASVSENSIIVEARAFQSPADVPDRCIGNAFGIALKSSAGDTAYLQRAREDAEQQLLAGIGVPASGAAPTVPPAASKEFSAPTEPAAPPAPPAAPIHTYTPDMPVEEILKTMTPEEAILVIIDVGPNKGKHLGEADPKSLSWYATGYKGNNNLLRAGAQCLLNAAKAA